MPLAQVTPVAGHAQKETTPKAAKTGGNADNVSDCSGHHEASLAAVAVIAPKAESEKVCQVSPI